MSTINATDDTVAGRQALPAAERPTGFFSDGYAPWRFLLPCIVVLLTLTLFPTLFLLIASFRNWSLIAPDAGSWAGLGNYIELATDTRFLEALMRTLAFTLIGVSAQLVLGMGVALLLAREFLGAPIARALMLLPIITTPIVVGLTWRMLYDPLFGQINFFLGTLGLGQPEWLSDADLALPALILTDIWQWTPFVSLILLAGLRSVPDELYEAAALDGAGAFKQFVHITLPVLRPLILIAVLFRTMDSLRWFDTVFVMTNGGPGTSSETANLYLYTVSFNNANVGYGAAMAVVLLILIIVVSHYLVKASGLETRR